MSLLLCLPFSKAPAERVFSSMKLTKTPIRNQLHDITLGSLLQAKSWLKSQQVTAATVQIPEELLKTAQKVKTNAPITE